MTYQHCSKKSILLTTIRRWHFNVFHIQKWGSPKKINTQQKFKLFGEHIPSCDSLKFLGITFDLSLSFKDHIEDIRKKCNYRLNIIKLLANKFYKLTKETLTTLFISLVRSIIDYSTLIIPCISRTLGKLIQATQNTAFRIIHRLKFDTHTYEVVRISGIPRIEARANDLNINFINNAKLI